MIKCTNCGSFIDGDSIFCCECGVRVDIAAAEKPNPGVSFVTGKCCSANPREHIVLDASFGFCAICAAPLIDESKVPLVSSGGSVGKPGPRSCPNGHVFNDPALSFCPECGMPIGELIDTNKPIGDPTPFPIEEITDLPVGMYPPTPDDLKRK